MTQTRKVKLPPRKNKTFKSIKEFILGRKLGDGAYAIVRKAIHIETESTYAIKIIALSTLGENDYENVEKELEIHSNIVHPHIIGLLDFFQDDEKVYLVLEFAQKGNLFKFMHAHIPPDPQLMGTMWSQTVSAIKYLHDNEIIMRDLKPENILVTKDLSVKICDFGWAARIDDLEYRRLKAGTYIYMSPESLLGKLQSYQSDVWSLGVLLFEMHHNREPFSCGISCNEQLYFIRQQNVFFKSGLDNRVKALVSGCLIEDKTKRFNLSDLINSIYVKEFLNKKIDPNAGKSKLGLNYISGSKPTQPIQKAIVSSGQKIKNNIISTPSYEPGKKLSGVKSSNTKRLQLGGLTTNNSNQSKIKTIRINDFTTRKYSGSTSFGYLQSSGLTKKVLRPNFSKVSFTQVTQNPKTSQSAFSYPSKILKRSGSTALHLKNVTSKPNLIPLKEIQKDKHQIKTLKKNSSKVIINNNINQKNSRLESILKNKIQDKNDLISEKKDTSSKKENKVVKKEDNLNVHNKLKKSNQFKTDSAHKAQRIHRKKFSLNELSFGKIMKRSNTQIIKPMFAPGFSQKHRKLDLFQNRKKKTFHNITKNPMKIKNKKKNVSILEKSLQKNLKIEKNISNKVSPDNNLRPVLKKSSSKMLIKLNSYKPKNINNFNANSNREKSFTSSKHIVSNTLSNDINPSKNSSILNKNDNFKNKPNFSKINQQNENRNLDNPNTLRTRDSSTNLSKNTQDPEDFIKRKESKNFVYNRPKDKSESFNQVLRKKTSVRKIRLNEYFNNK